MVLRDMIVIIIVNILDNLVSFNTFFTMKSYSRLMYNLAAVCYILAYNLCYCLDIMLEIK